MVATLLFLFLSLFLFIGLLPVVTFAQSDHLGVPTIAQIPSVEEQSQRGFLILTTNVINDNGGSKQASDFIINVLGSPSFPSILQAAQTPDVQIISIQAGYYSISVNNTQGYDTSFRNQCEGPIKAGEIKSCFITLDESSTTIDRVTTIPPLPIMPLSLPSLLLPPSQTSGEGEKLTISQIPLTEEEQSELGFLVVGTNVINDNGGSKQAPDFIINILGSPAFPSSFKAAFSNLMQVISIQPGQFSLSVNNTQGYNTSFGNQCEGQIKAGEIKSCFITLDESSTTIDKVNTIPQLPIMPLSLPSLLLPPSQTSGEEGEQLTISQIPLTEEEQSELGFLVVGTNVINDNGGAKQAPDFIINVLGSPSFPSSFKAAPSNLMQVISIQEGQFFISVNNTQGYDTSFGNQCEGQIKAGEIKTCLITVNDKGTTPPPPPPPTGDVDAKFAELIKRANPNELVILDGSGSTGTITSWSIVQTDGQPTVVLENAPTKPFSKQFIMPNTEDTLKFTLTVRNDQTGKQNTDTMTVSKTLTTPPPPPLGDFPVSNVIWFYDSKNALSKDMTLKSGTTHPQDRVLLSSGASGVSSHPIKNGFIEVQSGGGNGRVYWNYHEVPQFSQLPTAGFNTAMTGTFMFKPGIDNLSIKDG
ncbi:MAG TPA: hypothetical protein VE307_01775, partial [Nitrososphaeraceae archaeon]|nr:hypothetical protein [Nitrososphaeraceae archaeon]